MPRGQTDLRARRERLEAELAEIREREQAEEEQKAAVAGRAVLAEAERDSAFHEQLSRILENRLTKKRDRKLFGLPVRERRQRQALESAATTSAAASPTE